MIINRSNERSGWNMKPLTTPHQVATEEKIGAQKNKSST